MSYRKLLTYCLSAIVWKPKQLKEGCLSSGKAMIKLHKWRIVLIIIGVLIALGILIIVHEAGHYTAARLCGVSVEKFSIGFGPKILGYKFKGTNFLISLIPLGGYVKMSGDEPKEGVEFGQNDFYGKKWWQRSFIVIAGPLANLILGFFLFSLSFTVGHTVEDHLPIVGKVSSNLENILLPEDRIIAVNDHEIEYWSQLASKTHEDELNQITLIRNDRLLRLNTRDIVPVSWYTDILPEAPAIVGSVTPGMPAFRAGLQEGDVVMAVDGVEVGSWYEMRELIAGHEGESVELKILREEESFTLTIPLESNILLDSGQKMIGISQKLPVKYFMSYGLFDSIKYGALSTATFIVANYYALYRLVSRPLYAKDQVGGPVMIVALTQETSQKGWGASIAFMASISLILMIMNLLPIPVLDGGHIFFYLIEGITGKKVSYKVQSLLQQIGFMLLIALMIFVFFNDFAKLLDRNISLRNQQQQTETVEE